MLRIFTTAAVCLVFLIWQPTSSADTASREHAQSDAAPTFITFRSQPKRLQAELERHQARVAAGGWPEVPGGPTIRPGASDPRLEILAQRLTLSGDLADDRVSISTSEYNEALDLAVRRFQRRHALEVDGLVGSATLRVLNVSIERRIDQIRVNLARMRELSKMPMDNLVIVNTAGFEAFVVRGGEIAWTTKVIVGEIEDETPDIRSQLEYVVLNPSWSVPYSITTEEMLPKIKEDPAFFSKGGYELYGRDGEPVNPAETDWSTVSARNFPFTLVQRPGPGNQLGQIKFMFPNEYSVCMHDTPAKALFESAARAFSHGCIRVDKPRALAELVLDSEGWTREAIESQIASGETKAVRLSEPLPLHVLYWTAEVSDSGRIHFYPDLYQRDAKALKALRRRTTRRGFR